MFRLFQILSIQTVILIGKISTEIQFNNGEIGSNRLNHTPLISTKPEGREWDRISKNTSSRISRSAQALQTRLFSACWQRKKPRNSILS
ncbi:MAG TPA: hypothetical protein DCM07_10640 [Planctomycetaceae bacterium]|nr:hypothetical protein [Gimesia sp.]HAH45289.1 hypothetical protein [Planctomycetaceae bacterium]HBL43088.1 hypothetical protein [Planctomycetaceae bacterium]